MQPVIRMSDAARKLAHRACSWHFRSCGLSLALQYQCLAAQQQVSCQLARQSCWHGTHNCYDWCLAYYVSQGRRVCLTGLAAGSCTGAVMGVAAPVKRGAAATCASGAAAARGAAAGAAAVLRNWLAVDTTTVLYRSRIWFAPSTVFHMPTCETDPENEREASPSERPQRYIVPFCKASTAGWDIH